jgi:chromo domain-containing protein 1
MTNYVEQDLHKEPLSMIQDKYPILSERREIAEEHPVDYFNTLEQSQDEAFMSSIAILLRLACSNGSRNCRPSLR